MGKYGKNVRVPDARQFGGVQQLMGIECGEDEFLVRFA